MILISRLAFVILSGFAVMLTSLHLAAADESAAAFDVNDLVHGKTINKSDCAAIAHHVWIETVAGGTACLRYFRSDNAGNADRVLIELFPDMLNLQAPGGTPAPYAGYAFSPKMLSARASLLAARYGGPVAILARPGVFGSAGFERTDRHTMREANLINAAINQIKSDLRVTGIDIVGQSAGGTLAAAMAEQRTDVRCAVSSSGALSMVEAQIAVGFKPNAAYIARTYDPLNFIGDLKLRPRLRLIAISDPNDKAVAQSSTLHFFAELKTRNIPYLHIHAQASDVDHHDLTTMGERAVIYCAHGKSDGEIVEATGARVP